MRVYVSGPMRGIPQYNFPEFDSATAALRDAGFAVVSPAEHDRELDDLYAQRAGYINGTHEDGADGGSPFHQLIGWDLEQLARPGYLDAIFLLPGWETSQGVSMELTVARWTGKQVYYLIKGGASPHEVTRWSWYPEAAPPLMIGLAGYAQAGKDTVGRVLTEHAAFQRVSFADALRDALYAINPIVAHERHRTERGGLSDEEPVRVQDIVDTIGWERAKVEYPEIRELQQRTGTEGGRDIHGQDIWVNTALAKVNTALGGRYVFTDVRFPNEFAAVKAAGGEVWRITRPGTEPVNAHPSETALDGFEFDRGIVNCGTVDQLETEVLRLVSDIFASRLQAGKVDA